METLYVGNKNSFGYNPLIIKRKFKKREWKTDVTLTIKSNMAGVGYAC